MSSQALQTPQPKVVLYVLVGVSVQGITSETQAFSRALWEQMYLTAVSLEREPTAGPSAYPVPVQGALPPAVMKALESGVDAVSYRAPNVTGEATPLPDDVTDACERLLVRALDDGIPVKFLLCLDPNSQFTNAVELAPIVAKQCGMIVWGDPSKYEYFVKVNGIDVKVLTLDEYLSEPDYNFQSMKVEAVAITYHIVNGAFNPECLAAAQYAALRPCIVALIPPDEWKVENRDQVDELLDYVRARYTEAYGECPSLDTVRYLVFFGKAVPGTPEAGVGVWCFPVSNLTGFLMTTKLLMALRGVASNPGSTLAFDPEGLYTSYWLELSRWIKENLDVVDVPDVNPIDRALSSQDTFGLILYNKNLGTDFLKNLNSNGHALVFISAPPTLVSQNPSMFETGDGYPKFLTVIAFDNTYPVIVSYLFSRAGYELGEAVAFASWVAHVLSVQGFLPKGAGVYLAVGDPFLTISKEELRYDVPSIPFGSSATITVPSAFIVPFSSGTQVYTCIPLILPGFVQYLNNIPSNQYWTVVASGMEFYHTTLGTIPFAVGGILNLATYRSEVYSLDVHEAEDGKQADVEITVKIAETPSQMTSTVVVGSHNAERKPPNIFEEAANAIGELVNTVVDAAVGVYRDVSSFFGGVPAWLPLVALASLPAVSGATRGRARSSRTSR